MAEENAALDGTDRAILGVLATDGRITWRDLGTDVGLSANAAAERVRRLERVGVIRGYRADVDPEAVGRPLEGYVMVKMHPGDDRVLFRAYVAAHDAIVDAVHLTGPHDYIMHVRCTNTTELDDILMTVKREAGVADTETRIVLHRVE
jgi:Lrp/AsnC family leucine-responsive transcriptional regulator